MKSGDSAQNPSMSIMGIFRQLRPSTRNKFQIFVLGELIAWDEGTSRNLGIEDEDASAKLPHVPNVFGVIRINGHKSNFCRISVQEHTITSQDVFSGAVL
jgi:hypothetical protein